MVKYSFVVFVLLALVAGGASALVNQRDDSQLAGREFIDPALEYTAALSRVDDLPQSVRSGSLLDLVSLGVNRDAGLLDRRDGRWGTLYPAIPMIPGSGVGNNLTWESLGTTASTDSAVIGELAWAELSSYISERAGNLRLDLGEFVQRSAVFNDGALVQFHADRVFGGLPVRGAAFAAVLNNGNLALMGTHAWGDVRVSLRPNISADDAVVAAASFLAPFAIDALRRDVNLELVIAEAADGFAVGHGLEHRLVWVVRPDVVDEEGRWEALVDAHSGRVLSFQDLNSYGAHRNVNGGVYPITYDGIGAEGMMQDAFPMPFADVSSGGFTDAGGNFNAAGNVTTTLSGQFIAIADQCAGVFSETSAGDIALGGTDGDVDCTTPTAGDNTASARSGFYELNRQVEQAQSHLPANGWLMNQLVSNMNINNSCNAFWNGSTINFYREGFPCGNTGQIASVFDHEWGHGMDDNDTQGSVISTANGGGEGIADIFGFLRLNTSCVGRGFFIDGSLCGGYGDPCTPASGCTGIRDIDFANRTSGLPHDLTFVQTGGGCTSPHCRGAVYSESFFDLRERDLPSFYGMDSNTAHEVTTRLAYIAANVVTGWYAAGGTPNNNCSATFGYNQVLIADDDNGNLADGTPHMQAIVSAFARHEIDCSPANGGPVVQDSGCVGAPSMAPVVTATPTDTGADLSWSAVGGASSYGVYRTDSVSQCDYGKTLVGSPVGTSFSDSGLKNDYEYSYVVLPIGPSATCFGPASACANVTPTDGGGGGIPCADVDRFQARCRPGGLLQARVIFTDSSHNGDTATISIDGTPNVLPIIGDRARISMPGGALGLHTFSLTDPAGCVADIVVTCN